jgi:hypothetical protein
MSFAKGIHNFVGDLDPLHNRILGSKIGNETDLAYDALKPKTPTPPPTNNPNDALNAAQATADQLRTRRGLLSTIYAGATNTQPTVGKTQLGT